MKEKFIDVKGIRTRYLEAGTGEPLLLVHGADFGKYESANTWELNIDGFAKNFHVFAIDKIGAGFTDNPTQDHDYVIGSTVRHAYEFLKVINVDCVHLVGHSRGGYAVCRLALEHPELVKTLIIVDSATLMTPPNPIYDEWARQAALIENVRERVRYLTAVNSFSDKHITDALLDVTAKIATSQKFKEAEAKMEGGLKAKFAQDLVVRQKETHKWIRAGRLKAPTLIIWGFNDPSANFDPVGLATLELIFSSNPRAQMHIFNQAGHPCYREHPEAFVATVTSFIKSNSQ
ncbi:MAG: alpha/beta fold hydrolase [Thermodesulfobacteriota bacterium]